MTPSIPSALSKNDNSSTAWLTLWSYLIELRDVTISEKSASVHVDTVGAAFLGVHPRKSGLRLTIVLDHGLVSDRIVKREAVSKNRYHNEVDIPAGEDLDTELKHWIEEAYKLRRSKAKV